MIEISFTEKIALRFFGFYGRGVHLFVHSYARSRRSISKHKAVKTIFLCLVVESLEQERVADGKETLIGIESDVAQGNAVSASCGGNIDRISLARRI